MNRDQRRLERKRARFERSRRARSWDGKEVVERVFGPIDVTLVNYEDRAKVCDPNSGPGL